MAAAEDKLAIDLISQRGRRGNTIVERLIPTVDYSPRSSINGNKLGHFFYCRKNTGISKELDENKLGQFSFSAIITCISISRGKSTCIFIDHDENKWVQFSFVAIIACISF